MVKHGLFLILTVCVLTNVQICLNFSGLFQAYLSPADRINFHCFEEWDLVIKDKVLFLSKIAEISKEWLPN